MASAKPPVQQSGQQAGDSNNPAPQMGVDDTGTEQRQAAQPAFETRRKTKFTDWASI